MPASFTALECFLSRQNLVSSSFYFRAWIREQIVRVCFQWPITEILDLLFLFFFPFERVTTTPLDKIEIGFRTMKIIALEDRGFRREGGVVLRILLTCYTIEGDRAVSREASRAPQASKGTLTTLVAAKRLGRRHPATTYPTIRKTKQKPMYPADPVHVAFLPEFIPC